MAALDAGIVARTLADQGLALPELRGLPRIFSLKSGVPISSYDLACIFSKISHANVKL